MRVHSSYNKKREWKEWVLESVVIKGESFGPKYHQLLAMMGQKVVVQNWWNVKTEKWHRGDFSNK